MSGVVDVTERLRLITESIDEVLWMLTPDMRRLVYVSPGFERLWGRSAEDLYRNPLTFLESVHPEDRDRLERYTIDHRPGEPFEHEYRILDRNNVVRWISDRGYPVRAPDDTLVLYVGIAQDITARKRAASEMSTLGERLRLILKATADGMWDWDMVANTAWWSDTYYTTFQYDRATVPSFDAWADRIHPEDRERVLALFDRAVRDAVPQWSAEYRFVQPDGRVLDVFDRAYVLHDVNGRPIRMLGALMDITARRALENQLRQAQKMDAIGRLAGGIAHDFNNILQSATLDLWLLSNVPGLPTEAADYAETVREAIQRAFRLTRQLLVFSRCEVLRPRALDLNAAIVEVARMLGRILGEDIALELSLAAGSVTGTVDASMFDQVLINLAANARDAMPRGGSLAIATSLVDHAGAPDRPAGRYACIAVRDTGTGIAPEIQSRIFEPFFTTKEPGQGTGFGLATVHGIVEQHRGWVDVESGVGRGTTFRVYFPASTDRAATEPVAAPPRAQAQGSETLLLVEDDEFVRRALRTVLEEAGYRVIEADRAAAALATSEREGERISAMLTDLVMPGGMNGHELAVRMAARRPELKIIFMTGYSREVELPATGSHVALVRKPIDADNLLSVVRQALDR